MADFAPLFDRWARAVRRRLLSRHLLLGLAAGSVGASFACGLAWAFGAGASRAWCLAAVTVGVGGGWLRARRDPWSDRDVALFLDARLGTLEVVSTAAGLGEARTDDAAADVFRTAAASLDRPVDAKTLPRLGSRWLLLVPLAAVGSVAAMLAPTRVAASAVAAPGTDLVKRDPVAGLDAVEKLRAVDTADPEAARKLQRAAESARALREALKKGMERREALSRLAEIRDDIRSARLSGSASNKQAAEEAAAALRRAAELGRAADALRAGDLVQLDQRMHELANRAEAASREAALEALEQARQAAARRGAADMAEALRQQKELLEQRARDAELLRELAEALGASLSPEGRQALEQFRDGDLSAEADLARALAEALRGLTDEQRRALAERLAERAEDPEGSRAMTSEELQQLAERLKSPEGRQKLAETMRRLASPPSSPSAEREQALGDAEEGLSEAERDVASIPVPAPAKPGAGKGASGAPGSERDEGTGTHDGASAKVDGETLRAKAHTDLDPTAPSRAASRGRIAPGAGGSEPIPARPSDLEARAPAEIHAVERSDLPEAYREQVRRYFAP